jgi:hypothetical protein
MSEVTVGFAGGEEEAPLGGARFESTGTPSCVARRIASSRSIG